MVPFIQQRSQLPESGLVSPSCPAASMMARDIIRRQRRARGDMVLSPMIERAALDDRQILRRDAERHNRTAGCR
jgi:hypothetical protein